MHERYRDQLYQQLDQVQGNVAGKGESSQAANTQSGWTWQSVEWQGMDMQTPHTVQVPPHTPMSERMSPGAPQPQAAEVRGSWSGGHSRSPSGFASTGQHMQAGAHADNWSDVHSWDPPQLSNQCALQDGAPQGGAPTASHIQAQQTPIAMPALTPQPNFSGWAYNANTNTWNAPSSTQAPQVPLQAAQVQEQPPNFSSFGSVAPPSVTPPATVWTSQQARTGGWQYQWSAPQQWNADPHEAN